MNPERSDRYDGLDGALQNPIYVSHVVDAIIGNTGGPKGDAFFDAAEGYLLSALIFLQLEGPNPTGEYPTLGKAYRTLLETPSIEHMEALFAELPLSSHGAMKWNLFKKASPNLQGNVMIGLAARLQVLEHKEIAEIMSYPDMDFTLPGREKCAYFLILSDQDSTMKFISAMFFSLLFSRLVHFADNHCPGKRLPVAVNLLLDEYCNLVGAIKDFHIKVSSVRSRGLNIWICCQGIGQLQNRHPDNVWSEILGSMDTQICLGCNDSISAEYFSELTGEVSIEVDTTMRQKNSLNPMWFQPTFRQSEGIGRRKLMTPDEMRRMPHDTMLLFTRGQQVLEMQKLDYSRNAESKKFRPLTNAEKAHKRRFIDFVVPTPPRPRYKQISFPDFHPDAVGPSVKEVVPGVNGHKPEIVKADTNPDL